MSKKPKNRLEEMYGSPEDVASNLSDLAKKTETLRELRKVFNQPAGDNNEIIGRQTHNWNADSDQFNPYAPLADLLYQRDRLVEKASNPTSENPESELARVKKHGLGDKDAPGLYDKNGQLGRFTNIMQLNELDNILQERTKNSDKEHFNKIKQIVNSSRKKLGLSPVNALKDDQDKLVNKD